MDEEIEPKFHLRAWNASWREIHYALELEDGGKKGGEARKQIGEWEKRNERRT
jgi:hypothetical protein